MILFYIKTYKIKHQALQHYALVDIIAVTLHFVLGFFREFRPSEPFIVLFLTGEWRNITSVNRELYPIGTYSHLAQLVVACLVTDIFQYVFLCNFKLLLRGKLRECFFFFSYKIVIKVSACCGIYIRCACIINTYIDRRLQPNVVA